MFKQITIVVLSGANHLYDYKLLWPAKTESKCKPLTDIELLQYVGVVPLEGCLLNCDINSDWQNFIIPVHFRMQSPLVHVEWLSDLSLEHYGALTGILDSHFSAVHTHVSNQIWGVSELLVESDLSDRFDAQDKKMMMTRQEIEMQLYRNKINVEREQNALLPVSGVLLGKVGKIENADQSSVYSNVSFAPLIGVSHTVEDWLDKPCSTSTIVLGSKTHFQELDRLKYVATEMLSSRRCGSVRIVTSQRECVYSGNLFHKLYSRFKRSVSESR